MSLGRKTYYFVLVVISALFLLLLIIFPSKELDGWLIFGCFLFNLFMWNWAYSIVYRKYKLKGIILILLFVLCGAIFGLLGCLKFLNPILTLRGDSTLAMLIFMLGLGNFTNDPILNIFLGIALFNGIFVGFAFGKKDSG
ncbi:MAG: hypothetical protein ACUVWP_07115 [bacterium]